MKERIALGKNLVICQEWEESERGWGVRPDGFSLHATELDRQQYIKNYWKHIPDSVPDEYSRPRGTPYSVGVNDEVLAEVAATGNGKRYYSAHYPAAQ